MARSQDQPTFQHLQERAQQASADNRLDEASRLYRKALALQPTWADGWWSLGTLEYDQNHFAKAALAFERLIRLQPKNGTAHAMLGLCQFELGSDAPALKNLLTADRLGIVNNQDLHSVALYHLGILQLRARRFGDAYDTLHDLAGSGTASQELFTALGEAALLLHPQTDAAPISHSASVIERVGEAEALAARKNFAGAEQIYNTLTSQAPDFPNLHFAYGRMLLEAESEDQALKEFRRELQRDPRNVNSMLEIASVEYQVNSQDGLKYAEEAVKLAPEIPFAHYMLGMLRFDTGDAAGAIPELEIVRKSFPNQSKIYFALGNAYARVGRKADAAHARAEFTRLERQEKQSEASVSNPQASAFSARQMWIKPDKGIPRKPAE
ncbi:MAG TPA: tetratricopeptide repeat protein [Terriglobales bacterium]